MKSKLYIRPEYTIHQIGAPCEGFNLGSLNGGGNASDQDEMPPLQVKESGGLDSNDIWDYEFPNE